MDATTSRMTSPTTPRKQSRDYTSKQLIIIATTFSSSLLYYFAGIFLVIVYFESKGSHFAGVSRQNGEITDHLHSDSHTRCVWHLHAHWDAPEYRVQCLCLDWYVITHWLDWTCWPLQHLDWWAALVYTTSLFSIIILFWSHWSVIMTAARLQ